MRNRDPFLTYVAAFHLAWVAWPFVVYPRLSTFGEATFTYALFNIGLRLLVWVAPVVLYLSRVDQVDPVDYLRLATFRRRGVVVALVITALNVAGSVLRFGVPHPTWQSLTWNSVLGTSFMIGVIEEIPYRGFMLRKFTDRVGRWPANLVTSLLYVSIHVPGWIALHALSVDRAVSVFIFAVIMSMIVTYSRSLWAAIIAHSANDCLSVVFFHR
jgi:membrane protease YdiL (CAAX protease family)